MIDAGDLLDECTDTLSFKAGYIDYVAKMRQHKTEIVEQSILVGIIRPYDILDLTVGGLQKYVPNLDREKILKLKTAAFLNDVSGQLEILKSRKNLFVVNGENNLILSASQQKFAQDLAHLSKQVAAHIESNALGYPRTTDFLLDAAKSLDIHVRRMIKSNKTVQSHDNQEFVRLSNSANTLQL